jgi:hypothetical protein
MKYVLKNFHSVSEPLLNASISIKSPQTPNYAAAAFPKTPAPLERLPVELVERISDFNPV